MSITANTGPFLGFGGSNNPDRGPSGFDQGVGLLDPREPFSYKPGGNNAYMWAAPGRICVIQQVPAALAANNIALSQTPTAGTALYADGRNRCHRLDLHQACRYRGDRHRSPGH